MYSTLSKTLFLLLITLIPAHAQEIFGSFHHAITQQEYAGLKFRYKAFVRTEIQDADAMAALWIRVDRNGKKGFANNINDQSIKSEEWKAYSVEGTFDEDYTQIAFGFFTVYNGNFFLDDVTLEVQTKDKKWKRIYSNDFEKANDLTPGMGMKNTGVNALYSASLSTTKPHAGKQSLLVSAKDVPNYGTNSKVGKFANVNGIKLYYEVYGEGQPLVVLHGNGGSISNAAPHYPELLKRYKVIAVDNRAQGKSTDTEAALTYEVMASDVNALLDELMIDSACVWGQSDGAILGLMLAMNHPAKVKKLLAFGANMMPDSSAIFDWAVTDAIKQSKEGKDAKARKLNLLMVDHPNVPYANLSKIKIPVLIMAGDRDVIRPEHTLKLFQHIPKSQLCILPGTTHGASWEKKDLFLSLLYEFFDKPFTMPSTKDWY